MNADTEIYRLIEKYFSGDTSLEEEASLRKLLSATDEDSPEIRQAKAVISFFAAAKRNTVPKVRPSYRRTLWRVSSVAAALIVAAVLCVGVVRGFTFGREADMMAYIGGVKTYDRAAILEIVHEDFSSFREADSIIHSNIENDFAAINEAMKF